MASRTSTPQSRSRSSTGSSSSTDTTMIDAPPQSPSRPRLRQPSQSNPSAGASTAAANPTFSLILSLPRELRDKVYEYALVSQYPFWWPNQAAVRYEHNIAPSLLRTSRMIYDEAIPILYNANKFLFTHPSDCNIFHVVASPFSSHITNVYFRIREKDMRIWTSYLGSKKSERSLMSDLPNLKSLWIFLRCGSLATPGMLGPLLMGNLPPGIQAQVQAVQNAMGQQIQALQQQLAAFLGNHQQIIQNGQQQAQATTAQPGPASQHHATHQPQAAASAPPQTPQLVGMDANVAATATQVPPPPPPPPAMPFLQFAQGGFNPGQPGHGHHPQLPTLYAHGGQNHPLNAGPAAPTHVPHPNPNPNTLYTTFLRYEREIGLESLCLSLTDAIRHHEQSSGSVPPEVKIVCIMRIPKREVDSMIQMYPNELCVDQNGDARTRFRKLHGVEVSLEISGYQLPSDERATGTQTE